MEAPQNHGVPAILRVTHVALVARMLASSVQNTMSVTYSMTRVFASTLRISPLTDSRARLLGYSVRKGL